MHRGRLPNLDGRLQGSDLACEAASPRHSHSRVCRCTVYEVGWMSITVINISAFCSSIATAHVVTLFVTRSSRIALPDIE